MRASIPETNGTSKLVLFDPAIPTPRNLEAVPHSNLYLPWITKPIANRPVKVEQQRCRRWITEIVAIQNVEYFNQRLELTSASEAEGARESDVPARERIVPANGVAQQDRSGRDRSVFADSIRG